MTDTANAQISSSGMPVGRTSEDHAERIKRELIAAGVTRYGLRKFAAHYVYRIIHPQEHIMAVVYGRYGSGEGLFGGMSEGMLIATERRVIFLDYKPGFTDLKEFTYDVVSGIERITTALFSSVKLFTRIGNFSLRYANSHCVELFMEYIELRRLETKDTVSQPAT